MVARIAPLLSLLAVLVAPIGARAEQLGCGGLGSRDRPCSLAPDETATGALHGAGDHHHYRFLALDSGARARLALDAPSGGVRSRLVDWRARTIAETGSGSEPRVVEVTLDLPGAYEVVVEAAESGVADEPRPYSLTLGVEYGGPLPRVVLPSELSPTVAGGEGDADGATTLVDGRYTLNTRRGGSLSAGNAVARSLNLEGPDVVADFTLVADVHVDQVGGPAAATVRFRYQPEAGGGAGYLLSVDPFRGQVRLEGFDEGHREALTPWIDHPAAAVGSSTMRLMIRASGPTISASVDGQAVLRTVDARFADGMIVVGAVTWSDPITATFDNVLVTIPAP